jgi:hypothetical protein
LRNRDRPEYGQIRNLLPERVFDRIASQFRDAVEVAEENFEYDELSEDSLTGALSQSIRTSVRQRRSIDGIRWMTRAYSVGGSTVERDYGLDFLYSLTIQNSSGDEILTKTIGFQAKKNWTGAENRLSYQAESIIKTLPQAGLLVNFRPGGYVAVRAEDLSKDLRFTSIHENRKFSLSDALSKHFLECSIGTTSIYYVPSRKRLVYFGTNQDVMSTRIAAKQRLATTIRPRKIRRRR